MIAKSKKDEEDEDTVAWFVITAFNSEWDDFEQSHAFLISLLSDDDFSCLIFEDSDHGCEAPAIDETSDEENGCRSERECDNGSVEEDL